jgi:regulator of sirC expression with transglutaminase-like and TPR domain
LEKQAARLRQLAKRVHEQRVYSELQAILAKPDEQTDLIHAALLLAKLDNEEVDVNAYRAEFDRMGKKLAAMTPAKADDKAKLETLNKFFFEQRGFHGSRSDYYTRSNSYLNEVIDDREGLPITLSVLYLELGKKIGLKIGGIPFPGHFVVRLLPAKGDGLFVDVFENGATFDLDEAKQRIDARGLLFRDDHVAPATKKAIIVRMLYNLLNVAQKDSDTDAGLRYLNGILLLDPEANEERFTRSALRYNKGLKKDALDDINFILEHTPEGSGGKKKLNDLKRMIEKEVGEE